MASSKKSANQSQSSLFIFNFRLVQGIALAWFLGVLAIFIFKAPYWALMDDHVHWADAQAGFHGQSLWQYVSQFVRGDFGWGMFRPFYPFFVYLFYGAFHESSQLAYLALYFLNVSIFLMWAILFEKCANAFLGVREGSFKIYRWLFFIFCFLFSPNDTLFFFASLQERLLLFFASIAFLGMFQISQKENNVWAAFSIFIVGLLCALFSKATALFLIPPFVLWFLILIIGEHRYRLNPMLIILIVLLAVLGAFFLSIRGAYTSSYEPHAILTHWQFAGKRFNTPLQSAFITIITILGSSYFVKSKPTALQLYYFLVWPLLLICFLFIMLPWKAVINYYLIVPGGMFWTASKIIICFLIAEILAQKIREPILLIVTLVAIGVSVPSVKKLWDTAKQHHLTKNAVDFLKSDLAGVPDDQLLIRMPEPCLEASDAMSVFIGRYKLIKMLTPDDPFLIAKDNRRRLLILNGECSEIPLNFQPKREIFRASPWVIYE